VESGASWRGFWSVAGALAVVVALAAAFPGRGLPPLPAGLAVVAVLGVVAVGTLAARRIRTLRVEAEHLVVGRESVRIADIDAVHLAAAGSGVDAGAPVLGGGWTVPKGRTGLPLRLADGRTVLVPTRDPAALRAAVLTSRGTLEP
jgi:hypothetical protein